MATYTWQVANGTFGDANNWFPSSVPLAGDTALFNANGGSISGPGSVDTLVFSNVAWFISGQLTSNYANVLNGGTLTMSGGPSQLMLNAALSVLGSNLNLFDGALLSIATGGTATFGTGSLNIGSRAIGNFNGAVRFGSGGTTNAAISTGLLTVGGVFSLGTTAGGVGNLTLTGGGQAVVNAARDDTANYLQLGAVANSSGVVRVDGAGSLLLLSQNSGGVGVAGYGELDVTTGALARFSSGNNARNPALVLGVQRYSVGAVSVSGSGSSIASAGSVIVGNSGSASLLISGGASLTSVGLTSTQAALSVGAAAFGYGTISIQGAGSQLIASGAGVIGGDNRGTGTYAGGTGSISLIGGGLLQTSTMTVVAGSSISIDGASQENIIGDLSLSGSLVSYGTLSISGVLAGPGQLTLGGGFAVVGTLSQAQVAFTGQNTTLVVYGLSGTSQVSPLLPGDRIDLAGNSNVSISGNNIITATGSLVIAGGGPYKLSADGNGGTFVSIGTDTIGVFRFFDSNYGTHFFSNSVSEKANIIGTRPDLLYEGVGLQSIDPAANDANAAPVFRFFDTAYGTHFFTASVSERDTVISSRPDLLYEGTGFVEHTAQQPGDVGVYRFFDTKYGTHFYTADPAERATIIATRSDLIDEGIGFYAPSS